MIAWKSSSQYEAELAELKKRLGRQHKPINDDVVRLAKEMIADLGRMEKTCADPAVKVVIEQVERIEKLESAIEDLDKRACRLESDVPEHRHYD